MGAGVSGAEPRGAAKSVLFLSALDFKAQSIQVIRKTPEAFAGAGWDVDYVLARDGSKYGDYFYEPVIDPEGVTVHRVPTPLGGLYDRTRPGLVRSVLLKLRLYLTVLRLTAVAIGVLRRKDVDVLYGYEAVGTLALNILRVLFPFRRFRTVSRFQGVFYLHHGFEGGRPKLALTNWHNALAIWLPADLLIMTDDGTCGDRMVERLRSRCRDSYRFWPNGVDEQAIAPASVPEVRRALGVPDDRFVLVSVSRLQRYKRVDRGIEAVASLVRDHGIRDVVYLIVGEGADRPVLEALVERLGVGDHVRLVGAVDNADVKKYLAVADAFVSTYDVSNVGNPLLEAIRAKKVILTLDNGDTARWIRHRENGFLYPVDDEVPARIAADVAELMRDPGLRGRILAGIAATERERLWTWKERLDAEVREVEALLER